MLGSYDFYNQLDKLLLSFEEILDEYRIVKVLLWVNLIWNALLTTMIITILMRGYQG